MSYDPADTPSFLTPLLSLLERGYLWGQGISARRHEARVLRGELPLHLPRPVISVGNIVAGGTGKTPVVEALAREWLARGGKPALLSRGYKGGVDGNDEYRLLQRRLPKVPHFQNRDRWRGGRELLAAHADVDLFILDDGFQHRRLHRDLDLLLLDCTRPFGYGHCLPRGLLREPWTALARADAFLLTRVEAANPEKLAMTRAFLAQRFPQIPVIDVAPSYGELLATTAGSDSAAMPKLPWDVARTKSWAAFAGIGNPAAFFQAVRDQGLDLRETRSFPDHHPFGSRELAVLAQWGQGLGVEGLVCTEKDGVKLRALPACSDVTPPIYELPLSVSFAEPHPLDLLSPADHASA
ncbi:MAG: tetraacyldisaccharide 4'-kinase [Planctomycetota bacterium]